MRGHLYTCVSVAATERNGTTPLPTNDITGENITVDNYRELILFGLWLYGTRKTDIRGHLDRSEGGLHTLSHVIVDSLFPWNEVLIPTRLMCNRRCRIVHDPSALPVKLEGKTHNYSFPIGHSSSGDANMPSEGHWWKYKKTGTHGTRDQQRACGNGKRKSFAIWWELAKKLLRWNQ